MPKQKQDVVSVLRRYGLNVEYTEDYGNVKKVHTDRGVFALKKVRLSDWQRANFLNVFQYMVNKGFYQFVGPIPTTDGSRLIRYGDEEWYVMPWVSRSGARHDEVEMMKALAKLHRNTVREWKPSAGEVEQYYKKMMMSSQRRQIMLERFMETCEKKIYMSPFEWYYTSVFYEMMAQYTEAMAKFENWFEHVRSEGKMRVSLCHGRPDRAHFFEDDYGKGRFIGFEKSSMQSPVFDIYHYLSSGEPSNVQHFEDGYVRLFSLREEENALLSAFLLQPNPFYQKVKQYRNRKGERAEIDHVSDLQQSVLKSRSLRGASQKLGQIENTENDESP